MDCSCHGVAAYWQKDKRIKAGGFWECSVKRNQWSRDRYDRDPIFRIERQMQVARYQRAQTLKRQREALSGSLPHEG